MGTRVLAFGMCGICVLTAGCTLTTGLDGLTGTRGPEDSATMVPSGSFAMQTEAGAVSEGPSFEANPDAGSVDARPEATPPASDSGSDVASTDAAVGVKPADASAPVKCPIAGGGPELVSVGSFCIDATEVTNAQYALFLSVGPNANTQPAACAWNTSFTPVVGWPYAAGKDAYPVVYVDWCDAYAFCRWAGKRLCGAVRGGAADPTTANSLDNQHFAACTHNGDHAYPYGDTFDATRCNGVQGVGHTVPVASMPGCQGGTPGVYDLVGNVEEWQDACTPNGSGGNSDLCLNGAGSYSFGIPQCGFLDNDRRDTASADIGFRCCAP